jgi:DNA modification methylase
LDSPVKDRSVDLLITDIPYNVSSIFFWYLSF